MTNTNEKRYIEEDEIDLRELFQTLWNKKVFIGVFTFIVTVFAIVYAYMKTPIYETRAVVEIGNYHLYNNSQDGSSQNITKSLDNSADLVKKLNILYIDMFKNVQEKESQITSITIPKGSKEFIEIKSEGISNEVAENEITKVIKYIKTKHKVVLDDVKDRREKEIENIEAEIQYMIKKTIPSLEEKIRLQTNLLRELEEDISILDDNIKEIETKNPSLAALKLMEKRDLNNYIMNIKNQILEMKDKLDTYSTLNINTLQEKKLTLVSLLLPHNYKNSEIVGAILKNDYPTKPKKKLIVVVAFVTGFILSIFTVFFMQFISGFKEEKEEIE